MKPTTGSTISRRNPPVPPRPIPWWQVPLERVPSVGGPLDPAAPRAFWRLVHIAEMAGLITPDLQSGVSAGLPLEPKKQEAILAEVRRLDCTVTDLYVLVTLFSAMPNPVTVPILARETLSEADTLCATLDHLHELNAMAPVLLGSGELGLQLTPAGMRLAVVLMYRVVTAAI